MQRSGRGLAGLCALALSGGCAVDSLDRLGAGNHLPALVGDAGPALDGPLRPDALLPDARAPAEPTEDPALLPLPDAGAGVPGAGSELLPNADFEQGHDGWFGRGTSAIIDVLEAHGGSRAILSTNRASPRDGPAYDIGALVQPWRAYAVSAWVRNELDTQLVMLTLEGLCNGASLQARLATRVVATEWLQLTSGFLVPECPSGLQSLTLYVEGPPAFKNLLVDDVSLRQVTLSGEAEQTSSPTSPSCTGASGHAASNGNGNSDSNPSCNGNPGS